MEQLKEITKVFKKESKILFYLFISLIIIFKIVFFRENLWVITRTVFAIFWLFILPGFIIMYLWKEKFDLIERLIFGSILGVALVGIISYYLTLFNVNIRLQFILVPLLIEIVLIGAWYFSSKKNTSLQNS